WPGRSQARTRAAVSKGAATASHARWSAPKPCTNTMAGWPVPLSDTKREGGSACIGDTSLSQGINQTVGQRGGIVALDEYRAWIGGKFRKLGDKRLAKLFRERPVTGCFGRDDAGCKIVGLGYRRRQGIARPLRAFHVAQHELAREQSIVP